ncbi:MAG TPA: alpha/beta hydrolase [Armatimonadota bacterium]|nr:alpha/beta hydrolase [Armatimonadota bacterium]
MGQMISGQTALSAEHQPKTRSTERPDWYTVVGPKHAHPLLLVHGIEYSRNIWTPQLHGLADELRVIAPDLPGHGSLSHLEFSFESAKERLLDVIDTECGGVACVLGISLGGYVAMEIADEHPEKLPGMILSGCCSRPNGAITYPHRAYARIIRSVNHRCLNWIHSRVMRAVLPPMYSRPILDGGIHKTTVVHAVKEMMGREVGTCLPEYEKPVLFLNGKWDFLFRRHEQEFVSSCKNAELCIVPGAGHPTNLQNPNAYNDAVRNFVRTLDW